MPCKELKLSHTTRLFGVLASPNLGLAHGLDAPLLYSANVYPCKTSKPDGGVGETCSAAFGSFRWDAKIRYVSTSEIRLCSGHY